MSNIKIKPESYDVIESLKYIHAIEPNIIAYVYNVSPSYIYKILCKINKRRKKYESQFKCNPSSRLYFG